MMVWKIIFPFPGVYSQVPAVNLPGCISMDVIQVDHPLHWLKLCEVSCLHKKPRWKCPFPSDKHDTLKISELANVAPISTGSIELCMDSYLKIHPPKQTWNLKIDPWKRRLLLETIISRFRVEFRGCIKKILVETIGNYLLVFHSPALLQNQKMHENTVGGRNPNNPPGIYKTLSWDELPTSTGAGFLPSTASETFSFTLSSTWMMPGIRKIFVNGLVFYTTQFHCGKHSHTVVFVGSFGNPCDVESPQYFWLFDVHSSLWKMGQWKFQSKWVFPKIVGPQNGWWK